MSLSFEEEADLELEHRLDLVDRCDLLSRVVVDDGSGGQEVTYPTRLADVPCRYGVFQGGEAVVGGRVVSTGTPVVSLQKHTVVNATDRLVVTIVETGEVIRLQATHVSKSSDESWRDVYGSIL